MTPRFDWSNVWRKASTLLASLATVCGSVLVYYNQLEPFQQAQWPWWAPLALTVAIPVLTGLIPAATSFRQAGLSETEPGNADGKTGAP